MFDSGFGGLTVARALIDLLPAENLVYLGDTARYPYGSKPLAEVAGYAHEIARFLVREHDIKALVVACNTAAAAALDDLAASVDVPVLGVVEPGVRALVQASVTGRVAVIGTVGTVHSGAYEAALDRAVDPSEVVGPGDVDSGSVEMVSVACPGFVEFVERGDFDSVEVHVLAERLLAPVVEAKVDTLLLGCTHYPYLAHTITDVLGADVMLVSSADETAFELRRLVDSGVLAPACEAPQRSGGGRSAPSRAGAGPAVTRGTHVFCTTGNVNRFEQLGRDLLGPELRSARQVRLG